MLSDSTSTPQPSNPQSANSQISNSQTLNASMSNIYQQTRDMVHKTKEKARAAHDTVHETCHNRVAARLAEDRLLPVTPLDVLRYRYHHGVNLGSCFVLERWLTPSMYPQGADTSELAAVTASVNQFGTSATRSKFEVHWADMVSDDDLDWLVNVAHCTSIRLPIGYWTLGAVSCKGTPFEEVAPIYANAWAAVEKLVSRARARGIGTLIDLHGLAGGANAGDHSGTNNGHVDLWDNPSNLDRAGHCLLLVHQRISNMDGIVGLQLCNEAIYNAPGLYNWYDRTLGVLAMVDSKMPIYISDAWNLTTAITYTQAKNKITTSTNPVIIDTHCYWAFSDADKAKSPQMIIAEVPGRLFEMEGKDGNVVERGATEVIVGEYSCAMDESVWAKAPMGDKPSLTTQFGQAQSKRYQQRSGGSFFWTFKMDWMDGNEWGFVQQTKQNAITPPPNLTLSTTDIQARIGRAHNLRASKRAACLAAHLSYWSQLSPNKAFEHWRYETGWDVGFADAMAFAGMRSSGLLGKSVGVGGDKIGFLDLWVRKRILESCMSGAFVWEFETGLRQGVQAFYEAADI